MWRTKKQLCGAWAMRHRIVATKFYFCGAWAGAPQNSHISVAHGYLVRHRNVDFCGASSSMRHRNILNLEIQKK